MDNLTDEKKHRLDACRCQSNVTEYHRQPGKFGEVPSAVAPEGTHRGRPCDQPLLDNSAGTVDVICRQSVFV